jgi:integrase
MHDIQHAFASLALKNGADLKSASQLIGHTCTDTKTRIYQHIDFDMQKDEVNRVSALNLDFGNPLERVTKVDYAKRMVTQAT